MNLYTNLKGILSFFIVALLPILSYGQCNEPFFSAYLEGSGSDKCLEIYNPTTSSISLDGTYAVVFYFNGNTSAGTTINLSGTIGIDDVFILCDDGYAVEPIFADQTSSASFYNGNDAIALVKNGEIIDVIGQIGFNPGTQWGTDPTSTANNVLYRKSSVGDGDEDGSDAFDPSVEWDGFNQNDIEGFGFHFMDIEGGACDCDPPVAMCQDATVNLSEGGTITPEEIDAGTTFDCGFGSLDLSDETFVCDEVGTNTVTLSAFDEIGNSGFCSATVTVVDDTPPTAVCMNATVDVIEGSAIVSGGDIDGGSSDNCTTNFSVNPNEFSCDDVGNTFTVTLTVTDNSSNSSTCTAQVTIGDSDFFCCEVVANCMDATVSLSSGGALAASDVDDGSEGCGEIELEVFPSAFSCSEVGPNTVTLVVFDFNEDSGICTANVTVVDDVPPNAVCEDVTTSISEGTTAFLGAGEVGGQSTDNCGGVSLSVNPSTFECEELGENTVTLTVDDGTNTATCTATVTVDDPESLCCSAPVLSCPGNSTVPNDPGLCSAAVEVPLPQVVEGCGEVDLDFRYRSKPLDDDPGSWTSWMTNTAITLPVGRWQIQWRAKDEENNSDRCRFIIEVVDGEAPMVTCVNTTIDLDPYGFAEIAFEDVVDLESTSDNCGYSSSFGPGFFDCEDVGSTVSINVTVTDDAGNSNSCITTADIEIGGDLPDPLDGCSIGTTNTNEIFDPCTNGGEFELSTVGFPTPFADVMSFAYQEVCGDFEVIVQVTGITNPGWAGIMVRESCDPGAKKVAMKTQLTPLVRRDVRTSTNGFSQTKQLPHPVSQGWIRLVRTSHYFAAYTSFDGVNWYFSIVTPTVMSDCVQVGMFVEGINVATVTTATFQSFSINQIGTLATPGNWVENTPQFELEESPSLDLFPNPAKGEINVSLDQFIGKEVDITIFNTLGQRVKAHRVEEIQRDIESINLAGLKAGTYLMRIETADQEFTRKFVVE